MNIAEIRKQYPQYDDLSDEQLARGLHSKFYSDMDFGDFSQKIGLTLQAEAPKMPEVSDEARAQIAQNIQNYENPSWAKRIKNFYEMNKAANEGFVEGVASGAESVLNGATLGGYGWLDRKLGLGMQDRRDKLQERAEEAGVGGLNQGAQLLAEIGGNVAGAGGAIAKGMTKAGLKGLKHALAANALEGVGYGLTDSDKLEDIPVNVAKNVATGVAVPVAGRGLGVIGKGTGKLLGLTTGTGDAVTTAYNAGKRGSKEFVDNMRGNANLTDVVDDAKNHLNKIKTAQNNEYQIAMDRVGVKEVVDKKAIADALESVKRQAGRGKTYLTDKESVKFLDEASEKIGAFLKDPTNTNVFDFDNLKQAIGDIHVNPNARKASRVQTNLYNSIKNVINKEAPEYSKIMKKWQDAEEQIVEFEKNLNLKDGKSPAQALKKLQSALRNDAISGYGNNTKLVEKLQGNENDLVDALSGQALNKFLPRGLLAGGVGALQIIGGLSSGSLGSVASALASSPRLMGELAYKTGQARRLSKPATDYLDDYAASLINILQNQ